jgi:S-formylglutathione hydrolase FrmB
MACVEIRFWGEALQKASAMNVVLPERIEQSPPYPVLYLLGGLSDDHTIWHRRTRIEWYVRGLPLIVVMPDGGRGFYCDAIAGPACERHIIEDVIGFVDHFLPTVAERRGRVVGGLSMGGYGAIKLALKYPDMFCSATAHSGCHAVVRNLMAQGKFPEDEKLTLELLRIYGHSPSPDDDPFALAERVDRSQLPAMRLDCGREDFLLQHNRDFHAHLERLGIAHEYKEFPGDHTWDYWDLHIQEAIAFHCKALGI